MKQVILALAILCTAFLGGIFWIQLEWRAQRIKQAEEAEAQEKAQAYLDAITERHQQLDTIADDLENQIKLQQEGVDTGVITSNQAAMLYDEYTKSYREAEAQLQATQLNLSTPLPSTKYLDDEIKFGLLQRH